VGGFVAVAGLVALVALVALAALVALVALVARAGSSEVAISRAIPRPPADMMLDVKAWGTRLENAPAIGDPSEPSLEPSVLDAVDIISCVSCWTSICSNPSAVR
jgi:hypothetical protein